MQQLSSTRPWQVWWGPERAASGGAAAPAARTEGITDEEFQNKLLQLKSELQGSANGPATLEDMLRGGDGGLAPPDLAQQFEEQRKEIERLRTNLEQARTRILQFEKDAELWQTREKEYEMMLEEKSELIRQLHQQARTAPVAKGDGPSEEELIALHQELQRERQLLEEDRVALEEQFRQTELQMAKERAEIFKVRNEAQRMQNEIKRQVEILEREAKVRGEMGAFMKLREELQSKENRAPGSKPTIDQAPAVPDMPAIDRKAPEAGPQSRKSFFGGLFRPGGK
jgi:chromosome segregation ATPase